MVCPIGWVCQAVRAPGVKWTLAAPRRDPPDGTATASMKTEPLNQSLGPGIVSSPLRVISILSSRGCARSRADHDLDRLSIVHRAISVRDFAELDRAVEHAAGLDPSVD